MNILKRYIGELLREMSESVRFQTLYHGTTSTNAENILSRGFDINLLGRKSGESNRMPGISFSADYDVANEHAQWASEEMDDTPEVLEIDGNNFSIAPGALYFERWNELGDSHRAIMSIKEEGHWDGIQLFDPETGDGVEEQEVLIFDSSVINVIKRS